MVLYLKIASMPLLEWRQPPTNKPLTLAHHFGEALIQKIKNLKVEAHSEYNYWGNKLYWRKAVAIPSTAEVKAF